MHLFYIERGFHYCHYGSTESSNYTRLAYCIYYFSHSLSHSPPQLAGLLVLSPEVQTLVPIMWQIGPQLDFILAAFPFFLFYLDPFPPVLERHHPLLF